VQRSGTKGYQWVLDADIEACFDTISHLALMGRARARIKDKRVLLLVKAFLKAGVLTEPGDREDTWTGTPQGIRSPLLASIALAALDEHAHGPWLDGGVMSTADAVESPLPGDQHGGFGERPGETDRKQSRHRVPGRLNHCWRRLPARTGRTPSWRRSARGK
jgi:Reverse transcriptase (RNA-dependent DNA polymerase)